jgi:uncharacterized membrane protein
MSDLPPIPIVDGGELSDADKRLIALFDKLEEGQLDFLDQAGKRVIELSTAMLAVLFGVTAFGKEFPPPYLVDNTPAKSLALATLLFYLLALLAGVLAVQPRTYRRSHAGLDRLHQELVRIVTYKTRWFRVGAWLLFAGSLALAALIALIIWPA